MLDVLTFLLEEALVGAVSRGGGLPAACVSSGGGARLVRLLLWRVSLSALCRSCESDGEEQKERGEPPGRRSSSSSVGACCAAR